MQYGQVNFDLSNCETTCDGALVGFPGCTAQGSRAMPQTSHSPFEADGVAAFNVDGNLDGNDLDALRREHLTNNCMNRSGDSGGI